MQLHKLSMFDILALVLGSVIGVGAFTLPGSHFLPESGLLGTLLGFLGGGIAILFILTAYLEMIEFLRQKGVDGGEFSYVSALLGRKNGFIVGWGLSLCYIALVPLNAMAFVLVVRLLLAREEGFLYLYSLAGQGVYADDIIIASLAILAFAVLNLCGIKASVRVQRLISAALVIVIGGLFIVFCMYGEKTQFVDVYLKDDPFSFGGVARVLAVTPFLFVGFDIIPQVVTHLGLEKKAIARVAKAGVGVGALCYGLLVTMVALAYRPEEAKALSWALGNAVLTYGGHIGFVALLLGLAAAVFGGMNGFMIASSKLLFAMAEEGHLPKFLLHRGRYGVHAGAIVFVTLLSLLGPWAGRAVIGYIVEMCSFSAALAYAYVCYLAKKEAKDRKVAIFCTIGFFLSLGFLLLLLLPFSPAYLSPFARFFLVVWIILGLFYYLYDRRSKP